MEDQFKTFRLLCLNVIFSCVYRHSSCDVERQLTVPFLSQGNKARGLVLGAGGVGCSGYRLARASAGCYCHGLAYVRAIDNLGRCKEVIELSPGSRVRVLHVRLSGADTYGSSQRVCSAVGPLATHTRNLA